MRDSAEPLRNPLDHSSWSMRYRNSDLSVVLEIAKPTRSLLRAQTVVPIVGLARVARPHFLVAISSYYAQGRVLECIIVTDPV